VPSAEPSTGMVGEQEDAEPACRGGRQDRLQIVDTVGSVGQQGHMGEDDVHDEADCDGGERPARNAAPGAFQVT